MAIPFLINHIMKTISLVPLFALLMPAARPAPLAIQASATLKTRFVKIIPTSVVPNPLMPVGITGCFSDYRALQGATLVHHAVNVQMIGNRQVSDVRIVFSFFDIFGDAVRHYNIAHFDARGGATIKKINLDEWSEGPPPAKISCAVDAVRYDDGSTAK